MECTQVLFSESFSEKEPVEKVPVATLQVEGIYHTIYNKENFIGRDDSCDIVIKNNAVSSKHAVVDAEDISAHFIRDLSSTNKTKLGQVTLKPNVGYAMKDGDCILFGNVSATYNISKGIPATPEKQDSNTIPETPEKDNLNIIIESPEVEENDSSVLDKSEIDMFNEKTRDSIMNTEVTAVGWAAKKKELNDDNDRMGTINLKEEELLNKPLSSNKPSIESDPLVIDDSDEETFMSDNLPTEVSMKEEIYIEPKNSSTGVDGNCIEKIDIPKEETHREVGPPEDNQSNIGDVTKEELETSHVLKESFDVPNSVISEGEQSAIDIASNDSAAAVDINKKEMETKTSNVLQNEEQLDEDFFIPASQNEDIFESSSKDINISINNTFGSFSDSGDESMLQVTTQQLKEELSVSDILPEEKDFDQRPEKLVEFLEPSSQPFDDKETSVVKGSVSEVDETLSSTISSNIFETSGYSVPEDKDLFSPTTEASMDEALKEGLKSAESKASEDLKNNKSIDNASSEHTPQSNNEDEFIEKRNLTFNQDFYEAETQPFVKEDDNVLEIKDSNQIDKKSKEHDSAYVEHEKAINNLDLPTNPDKCEKNNVSNKELMEIDGCGDTETKQSSEIPKKSNEAKTQPANESNKDSDGIKISESLGKEVSDSSDIYKAPALVSDISDPEEPEQNQNGETNIKSSDLTFTQGFYEAPTQPWVENEDADNIKELNDTEVPQNEATKLSVSIKDPAGPGNEESDREAMEANESECKLNNVSFTSIPTLPCAVVKDDDGNITVTEVTESSEKDASDVPESSNQEPVLQMTDNKENDNIEIKKNDLTFTEGFYEAPTQPWPEVKVDDNNSNLAIVTESPEKDAADTSVAIKEPSESDKASGPEIIEDNKAEKQLSDMTFTQGFYEAPTQPWSENNDVDTNKAKVVESSEKEAFKTPFGSTSMVPDLEVAECKENENTALKVSDMTFTQGFYEAPTQPWAENNNENATKLIESSEKETTDVFVDFKTPSMPINNVQQPDETEYNKNGETEINTSDMTFTQGFYEAPTQPWTENIVNDDSTVVPRVTESTDNETSDATANFKVNSEPMKKTLDSEVKECHAHDNTETKKTVNILNQDFYEAPTQPWTESNDNDKASISVTESPEKESTNVSVSFKAPENIKKLSEDNENDNMEVKLADMTFTQGFYEAETQPWVENKDDDSNNSKINVSPEKEAVDISVSFKTPSKPAHSVSNPELTVHNEKEEAQLKLPDMTFTQGFYEAPTQPWTEKDGDSNISNDSEKYLKKPSNTAVDDQENIKVDKGIISNELLKKDSLDESSSCPKASSELDINVSSLKAESSNQKNSDSSILFSESFYEAPTQPFNPDVNNVKNAFGDNEETSDKKALDELLSCFEAPTQPLINKTKTNEETTKTKASVSFNEASNQPQNENKVINQSHEYNETLEKEVNANSEIKIINDFEIQIPNKAQEFHEAPTQPNVENVKSLHAHLKKKIDVCENQPTTNQDLLVSNNNPPEESSSVGDNIKNLPFTQGFYEAETQPYIDQTDNIDDAINNSDNCKISAEPLNEISMSPVKSDPKKNLVNSKDNIYDLDTEPIGSEEKPTSPKKECPKQLEPNIYELDTEPYCFSEPKKDLPVKDDLKPSLNDKSADTLSSQNEKLPLVSEVPIKTFVSKLPDINEVKMDLSDSFCVNSIPSVNVPKGSDNVMNMTLESNVDMSLSCINLPEVRTKEYSAQINNLNKGSSNKTDEQIATIEKVKSTEKLEKTGEILPKDITKNESINESDFTNDDYLSNKEEKSQEKLSFMEASKKNKALLDDSTDSSQEFNVRFQKKGCNVFPPDTQDLNDISNSSTNFKNDKSKNDKIIDICSDDSENSSQEFNIKFHKKDCNVSPPDTQEVNRTAELSSTSTQNTEPANDKIKSLIVEDSENSSQEFNIKFQKKGCNVFPPDTQDFNEISSSSTNNIKDKSIIEKTVDLSNDDSENSSQELNIKFKKKDCNVFPPDTQEVNEANEFVSTSSKNDKIINEDIDNSDTASQEFNIKFHKKGSNVFPPDTQEINEVAESSLNSKDVESNVEEVQIDIDKKSDNSTHESNLISENKMSNDVPPDPQDANENGETSTAKKGKKPTKRSKSNLNENSEGSLKDINDDKGSLRRSARSIKPFSKSSPLKNSATNVDIKSSDDLPNKRSVRELRKRDSYDSQNDSQGSNFDYSEGDDLGRGKRKRVKTSFDGFVLEEDLKIYRKKSVDSPPPSSDSQSRKSQRLSLKMETTNDIKDSSASTSQGTRNLKIVLHDIKNSKPTTQTRKSPSSIISADDDDDLIMPEPSKKTVSLKLNSTKNSSNSKPDVKSQNFSFCDKLDELFDIWGPADTVKLTPRTAKKTAKLLESEETSSKRRRNIFPEKSSDLKEDTEKPSISQSKASKSTVRKTSKEHTSVSKATKISPKHKIEEVLSEAPVEKKPRKKISEPECVEAVKEGIGSRVTRTSSKKKSDAGISDNTASASNKELSSVSPPKKKKVSSEPDLIKDNSENISNDNKSRKGKPTKKTNQLVSKNKDNLDAIELSSPTTSYLDDIMPSQEFSFHERATNLKSSNGVEFKTPQEIRRSSRSKKSEKNTEEKKVEKVMFTGFTDRKLTSLVTSLGGEVVESPFTCTVLVTDKVKRTTKFLSALSRGLPIVTPDWLHASSKAGKFSDFEKFIISDKEAEKKFSFSLKDSLKKSSSKKLLDGWSIFVTPSVKPPPEEIKSIVECSGGKFLSREPARWMPNSVIISCVEDKSKWNSLKKRGKTPPIVGTEALFSGILQQKLDIRSHCLV